MCVFSYWIHCLRATLTGLISVLCDVIVCQKLSHSEIRAVQGICELEVFSVGGPISGTLSPGGPHQYIPRSLRFFFPQSRAQCSMNKLSINRSEKVTMEILPETLTAHGID